MSSSAFISRPIGPYYCWNLFFPILSFNTTSFVEDSHQYFVCGFPLTSGPWIVGAGEGMKYFIFTGHHSDNVIHEMHPSITSELPRDPESGDYLFIEEFGNTKGSIVWQGTYLYPFS